MKAPSHEKTTFYAELDAIVPVTVQMILYLKYIRLRNSKLELRHISNLIVQYSTEIMNLQKLHPVYYRQLLHSYVFKDRKYTSHKKIKSLVDNLFGELPNDIAISICVQMIRDVFSIIEMCDANAIVKYVLSHASAGTEYSFDATFIHILKI